MALFKKTTTKSNPKASEPSMKELYADKPAAKGKQTEKAARVSHAQYSDVLVKPLISEKATHQQALNQYFFAVKLDANRVEVAKAVQAIYGVKPTKVTMMRRAGKVRRFGRTTGRRKDWKKAIVSLPKGKTISLYEGV